MKQTAWFKFETSKTFEICFKTFLLSSKKTVLQKQEKKKIDSAENSFVLSHIYQNCSPNKKRSGAAMFSVAHLSKQVKNGQSQCSPFGATYLLRQATDVLKNFPSRDSTSSRAALLEKLGDGANWQKMGLSQHTCKACGHVKLRKGTFPSPHQN